MPRAALIALAFTAACGGPQPAAPIVPRGQKLAAPLALDATAPGAVYLTMFAAHVQPNWAQFLEDCRLRLPPTHPLNDATLAVVADVVIDRSGTVTLDGTRASGNPDFDSAVRDVMADVRSVEPPPTDLLGDDDRLHLEWTFARDMRQAGPATARMVPVRQDVVAVTRRLLAQHELPRAARRIARALDDAGRADAARLVALAVLEEALAGSVDVRVAAITAIDDANLTEFAPSLRVLLDGANDTHVRLAVVKALGNLRDTASADRLFGRLSADLAGDEALALADLEALKLLETSTRASGVVKTALLAASRDANSLSFIIALHAHALAPWPNLDAKFEQWFTTGSPQVRAAVCESQPFETSKRMVALIGRGLRDADASVRASCAGAAGEQLRFTFARSTRSPTMLALEQQLRGLVRDRDQNVRARALSSLSRARPMDLEHGSERSKTDSVLFVDGATDASADVRLSAIGGLEPAQLIPLLDDPDPRIRSRALAMLGARGGEHAARLAKDPDARVRRAAVFVTDDQTLLAALAASDSYDVSSEALVKLAQLRGQAASTSDLMLAIAAAPVASAERVRLALAWLLAAIPPSFP
ncbi:MAG TPA: HEAT repeat domain-containing protein [Kofleriaceae bacterium]|jgi:hypothetical protein